jgi:hypothetical protein
MDWDHALRLAERHRVLPALHACLSHSQNTPASIRAAVRARFDSHARKTLRFSAELLRVARHFADCGIPALAHKGPALSQFLYADPAFRQFVDLDFLVHAHDVGRARKALSDLGYEPRRQLSPRMERAYLRSGYEYVFGLNHERNLLEIQWQILPRFYSVDFAIEDIFHRSVELQFEGFTLRTLRSEDLALVLCVHAAKHEWAQLAMLRDIASLARLNLDWNWIATEANRLGISQTLQVSFLLAHDLLGSEVPFYSNSGSACAIVRRVRSNLSAEVTCDPESPQYFRFMMQLRERWHDRLRFGWRLATTPGLSEWETFELPDSVFFLYRGVRMFRLARRLLS